MAALLPTTEDLMENDFRLRTVDSAGKQIEVTLLSASLHRERSGGKNRRFLRLETSSSLSDPTAALGHLRFELVLADPQTRDKALRDRIAMTAVQVVSHPRHPCTYIVVLACLPVPMDAHEIAWELATESAQRVQVPWPSLFDWVVVSDPRTPGAFEMLPSGSFKPAQHAKLASRTRRRQRTASIVPTDVGSPDETSFASL